MFITLTILNLLSPWALASYTKPLNPEIHSSLNRESTLQHQCSTATSNSLITITCRTRLIARGSEEVQETIIESRSNISNSQSLINNLEIGLTPYAVGVTGLSSENRFVISGAIIRHTNYLRETLNETSFDGNNLLPGNSICFETAIPNNQVATFQDANYIQRGTLNSANYLVPMYNGTGCSR